MLPSLFSHSAVLRRTLLPVMKLSWDIRRPPWFNYTADPLYVLTHAWSPGGIFYLHLLRCFVFAIDFFSIGVSETSTEDSSRSSRRLIV